MIRSLVLRFSDFEAGNSIARHKEIIDAKHRVLWGWWKKEVQEPLQPDVLNTVGKLCPIKIGLANTMADEYHVACCTRIFYDSDGNNIPCPDLSCTPAYYSNSNLPAWFQLSSIKRIRSIEFDEEFGGLPRGNNTLFAVKQSTSGRRSLAVPSTLNVENVETSGTSILHLSDLHFGKDHGFVTEKVENPVPELPLEDIIFEGLQSHPDIHIGIVVVSGDFISIGDANNFPLAQKFLKNLLALLHLGEEHLVMVPGNHDIPVNSDKQPTINYKFEEQYLMFIRAFFGEKIYEINGLHSFHTPENWHINFLALNSCRPRLKEAMDYGFVGKDRYKNLLQRMKKKNGNKNINELARDKMLNFAVFHHHLLPGELVIRPELQPEPRPVSMTLDAGEIVTELQNSAFHFVLHGHQHIPFIGSTSRINRVQDASWGINFPIIIIGMGSSGAKVERLAQEEPMNTFGIYTPKEDGLHIIIDEYNKAVMPRTFLTLTIPFE